MPHQSPSESTTLDVLQAYDGSSKNTERNSVYGFNNDTGDISPSGSPSRADFRLSAISVCSTSNLVTPEQGPQQGELRESPFRWNYPSLSELPIDAAQRNSQGVDNKRNLPAMRMWEGWKVIVCCSWFNVLLILIPVSWVLSSVMGKHHKLVFTFSTLSMIPLVKLHDLSTRELALRIGGAKTGLLNASMSNTVELVIAITALRKCELRIVQAALIGSILSKLLLVLGMCFFAGGLRFSEQGFDQTATQIHSSLLSISVGALLLPAAYHFALSGAQVSSSAEQRADILKMSHGVSIVLMFIYFAYLLFQFWSHRHLYKDVKQKSDKLSVKIPIHPRFLTRDRDPAKVSPSDTDSVRWVPRAPSFVSSVSSRFGTLQKLSRNPLQSSSELTLAVPSTNVTGDSAEKSPATNPTVRLVKDPVQNQRGASSTKDSDPAASRSRWLSHRASTITSDTFRCASPEPMSATELPPSASVMSADSFKEPRLSLTMTLLLLTLVTIMVAFNAEELVESMDGISTTISKQWVGLILLPAVSSIAECVTAMNVSVKDQLSLSVSVAVGSTIQTTLFVIPFMVTLGWVMNKPLGLLFDPFESVVLYIAVQTMSYVVADGKSNWLEGAILICLYVIIAVTFWYYPGLPSEVATCVMDVAA
ncbi:Sodium/calcium exchanger protein-domain-containing protein [Phlebopus sp. FC_14]|nr:Sodium/calcium exchanger protein-domain-containing protein [Phlebopus sp. FC_14]